MTPSFAEGVGRAAARFVKKARPRIESAASEAVPRLRRSGKEVLDFAKEHEDDLRAAAKKVARTRLTGPLGLVFDAVTANPMSPSPARAPEASAGASNLACPSCSSANPPSARFCNQCGSPMGQPAERQL